MLAQAGEGSVRDSLSALDQAIACCGTTLERRRSARAAGRCFRCESLREGDRGAASRAIRSGCSKWCEELERNGQNLQHFCRELVALLPQSAGGADRRRENTKLIAASAAGTGAAA